MFRLLFWFLFIPFLRLKAQERYQLQGQGQGTTWSVIYYYDHAVVDRASIDSIFQAIDSSLSVYKPYSLITRFNKSDSGGAMDVHFKKVVTKALHTYSATRGAFDITYACRCNGSQYLMIREDSLFKTRPFITIDVNGIAQGYTVDLVADFLWGRGIQHFMVEIGGEIRVSGPKPSGEFFSVGIESATAEIGKIVALRTGAMTTSGNYRNKYHIVDPSSGKAVANELVSVTVWARDAFTADAYDNALMVMGLKRAYRWAKKSKEIEAHFIYRRPDGSFREKQTKNFPGRRSKFKNQNTKIKTQN